MTTALARPLRAGPSRVPPCAVLWTWWDLDTATPAEARQAAELCLDCPILEGCRERLAAGAHRGQVVAGRLVLDNGTIIRATDWPGRRRRVEPAPAPPPPAVHVDQLDAIKSGRQVRCEGPTRVAAVRYLAGLGMTDEQVAARLACSARTVIRVRVSNGIESGYWQQVIR